jgi:hypothetical protein
MATFFYSKRYLLELTSTEVKVLASRHDEMLHGNFAVLYFHFYFVQIPAVRPLKSRLVSSCMQLENGWTDLCEFWYWGLLLNSVETFKFLLKSNNKNERFLWRPTYTSLRGSDWSENFAAMHSSQKFEFWPTRQNCYAVPTFSDLFIFISSCFLCLFIKPFEAEARINNI